MKETEGASTVSSTTTTGSTSTTSEITTSPDTTTVTTTTATIPDQWCAATEKCVCFKPVHEPEKDGFEFEWHNFLYGGLAGVGAIVLLVVVYQLICFKEKKVRGGYNIGMSDYVSDDVA